MSDHYELPPAQILANSMDRMVDKFIDGMREAMNPPQQEREEVPQIIDDRNKFLLEVFMRSYCAWAANPNSTYVPAVIQKAFETVEFVEKKYFNK